MRPSAAAILVAALAVGACGGPGEPTAATTPSTATTPITNSSSTTTITPSTTTTTTAEPVVVEHPFTFECTFGVPEDYDSLAAVWRSEGAYDCTATMDPEYTPTRAQREAAAAYIKADLYYGEDGPTGALEDLMAACAEKDADVGTLVQDRDDLPFVLRVCPKAPHANLMRQVRAKSIFVDGDLAVGEDVKPGTYRTGKKVHDCYWERSTKGGKTIANDFVTNAPAGVTVTIRSSDGGFSSNGCGTWLAVK